MASEPVRPGEVADRGAAEVAGQATTHYRIELDASVRFALGRLSPGHLAWFELEYPASVTRLEVWVSDDLIRRIRVVTEYDDEGGPASGASAITTTEFSDFGADITIEPPT